MREPIVEIRDRDRARIGLLGDTSTFVCAPRENQVGVWSVSLPAMLLTESGKLVANDVADQLRAPGAGIIVTFPNGRVFSGPMEFAKLDETSGNPGGTWTITGVSDLDAIAGEVAYPEPANDAPGQQEQDVDARSGIAETLLHTYVDANIGPSAPASRRYPGLTMGPNLERGPVIDGSPRFQNLLELLQQLAARGGILFDLVQVGAELQFITWIASDVSTEVRMSVSNDGLSGAESAYGAPGATEVIVLGKGLETMRTVVRRTSPEATAAGALWARRRVRVIDQRSTEVTAELQQAGDEVLLAEGTTIQSLDVEPSEMATTAPGEDFWVGDLVTVTAAGEDRIANIAELRISLTAKGLRVGATVGQIDGFDADRALDARVTRLESRASSLERNSALPDDVRPIRIPRDSAAVTRHVRLARIDGRSSTEGAHVLFTLWGVAPFGGLARTSATVHLVQRGSNIIECQVWGHGYALPFFTRQVSAFVFELWARLPIDASPTVLSPGDAWNGQLLGDSLTTATPSGLVPVATNFDTGA